MNPLLSSLIACLIWPSTAAAAQTPPSTAADRAEAVQGDNAFAVALYGQLRNQRGNLFFSPVSVSTALAMTYAGARGATASEMAKTLHFTLPPERLHPAMGALVADLNAAHEGYELRLANALWAQKNYTFLDDFLKLTRANYGAGFQPHRLQKRGRSLAVDHQPMGREKDQRQDQGPDPARRSQI